MSLLLDLPFDVVAAHIAPYYGRFNFLVLANVSVAMRQICDRYTRDIYNKWVEHGANANNRTSRFLIAYLPVTSLMLWNFKLSDEAGILRRSWLESLLTQATIPLLEWSEEMEIRAPSNLWDEDIVSSVSLLYSTSHRSSDDLVETTKWLMNRKIITALTAVSSSIASGNIELANLCIDYFKIVPDKLNMRYAICSDKISMVEFIIKKDKLQRFTGVDILEAALTSMKMLRYIHTRFVPEKVKEDIYRELVRKLEVAALDRVLEIGYPIISDISSYVTAIRWFVSACGLPPRSKFMKIRIFVRWLKDKGILTKESCTDSQIFSEFKCYMGDDCACSYHRVIGILGEEGFDV